MSRRLIVWRLSDTAGQPAQCVISERDGRWHLLVRHGTAIVVAERCRTDDAALDRADAIWQALVAQGWTEPKH
jgi:DNA polymerase IIIc chi subunit